MRCTPHDWLEMSSTRANQCCGQTKTVAGYVISTTDLTKNILIHTMKYQRQDLFPATDFSFLAFRLVRTSHLSLHLLLLRGKPKQLN